jgi:epoxyqueuosine reductase
MTPDPSTTARVLLESARRHGFHLAAIVPVEPAGHHDRFADWIAHGHAGDMGYLSTPEHVTQRAHIGSLLDGARTLVVVALSYGAPPPRADGLVALRGRIARYAQGEDYHMVLRDKLAGMAEELGQELGCAVAARPCVDAAPVLERSYAARGGLGFVAKNTMLISPGLGSYTVLGELLLDVEATPSAPATPVKPRCGSCRACLEVCPTQAFVDEYVLDARRCISYLTIELRGAIPRELRPLVGNWIFGCDLCQEVCPYNRGRGEPPSPELAPRSARHEVPDLAWLATAATNQLRQFVRRTPMRRAPRDQLLRNVAVALGNSGRPEALPPLWHLLQHRAALVRGHAAWALGALAQALPAHADAIAEGLRARLAVESDASVVSELALASSGS